MSDRSLKTVSWRILCPADIEDVFDLLATDSGRCRFWCETSRTNGRNVIMTFPNGEESEVELISVERPSSIAMLYFGARTRFELSHIDGGCVVKLEAEVPQIEFDEVNAGWVSVLMNLKAAAGFGIDLRNHNARFCWANGFADN